MTIYVGKWDLLPDEWEGINGLYEKSEEELKSELVREVELWAEAHEYEDNRIGIYTPEEFEEEFNADNDGAFNGTSYFIKIF